MGFLSTGMFTRNYCSWTQNMAWSSPWSLQQCEVCVPSLGGTWKHPLPNSASRNASGNTDLFQDPQKLRWKGQTLPERAPQAGLGIIFLNKLTYGWNTGSIKLEHAESKLCSPQKYSAEAATPPPHVDLNILEEICIINRTTCMKLINWGLVCITAQLWNSSELNLHVPLQAPHMQGITFVNN